MKKWKTARLLIARVVLICLISTQMGISSVADEAVASVMRLAGAEGTVLIESQNGKAIEIRENLKLYSGNTLKTEKASYAYVSLDDTKAVKLDALSKAQIRKSGKKLELLLESGNLFFNVTAPLTADESLNIRTSTTITGIRGTAGFVNAVNEKETEVSLLDGTVVCRGYDPADGQLKNFTIQAGQKANFYTLESDGMAQIILEDLSEADIPGFVSAEIKKSEALQREIIGSTNLDVSQIIEHADETLRKDEAEAGAVLDSVNKALGGTKDSNHSGTNSGNGSGNSGGTGTGGSGSGDSGGTGDSGSGDSGGTGDSGSGDSGGTGDPGSGDSGGTGDSGSGGAGDPGSGGSNGSGGSDSGDSGGTGDSGADDSDPEMPPDPPLTTVSREMPISIEELNTLLKSYSVVLSAGSGSKTLTLDASLSVPQGKKLTLSAGIPMTVKPGATLSVHGTIEISELFTNGGTIHNTGLNTFVAKSGMSNEESGIIDNMGRLLVTGRLDNRGIFNNQNQLEVSGIVSHQAGRLVNSGSIKGKVESAAVFDMTSGKAEHIRQTKGKLTLTGGEVNDGIYVGEDAIFNMSGGAVYPGSFENGVQTDGNSILTGGTIYAGQGTAVFADRGNLELNGTAINARTSDQMFKIQDSVKFIYREKLVSKNGRFNLLRDGESYVAGGYFASLSEALQGAVSGERVTVRPNDKLYATALSVPVDFTITQGDVEHPVVLDLNGQDVELLSRIVLGSGNDSGALTIMDSGKGGSLLMRGTGSESRDMEMFSFQGRNGVLNLQGVEVIQNAHKRMIDTSYMSTDCQVNITDCTLEREEPFDEALVFLYDSCRAVIHNSSLIDKTSEPEPNGKSSLLVIEGGEAELMDSRLIQGTRTAVFINNGTLTVGGESLIQNNSSLYPAIYRDADARIEFDGGIIQNQGGGCVFWDKDAYGLPAENMDVDIIGAEADLFGTKPDYSLEEPAYEAYTPQGYRIQKKADGNYHILPEQISPDLSEPSEPARPASPADAENMAPSEPQKPASSSNAGRKDSVTRLGTTSGQEQPGRKRTGEAENDVYFLLPEKMKNEVATESGEEIQ